MKKEYTIEFKRQAVELAETLGSGVAAGKQLGISDSLIYSWRARFKQGDASGNGSMLSLEEQEELKRLRRENSELKKVNYILKRAAAFFSQDQLK